VNKTITCIVCPISCEIVLHINADGEIESIKGNRCARGHVYATKEHTAPERILTSTIEIKGAVHPLLPVRTDRPIPKNMLKDAVRSLADLAIEAPVQMGECIAEDFLGLNVNLIASRNLS